MRLVKGNGIGYKLGMAHAGGRPTSLTPELTEKAWEYVDSSDNMGVQALLPTIERLALTLEVSRETLYQWESLSEEFSDILNKLRAIQADKLIQNGLLSRYSPVMSKMMLSKHGYVEESKQEQSGEVKHTYEELDDEKLDAAIKAREDRISKAAG